MCILPFMSSPNSSCRNKIHISKGSQCALTVITIMASWQLLHLGHRKYVYTLFGLHCEVSAQTVNSEQCIVQKVNVPRGGSSPNPRECSNCLGSGRNIQRITMCPHGYHHNGFMATPALGTQEVRYIYIYVCVPRAKQHTGKW